jgi:hypothetical protein
MGVSCERTWDWAFELYGWRDYHYESVPQTRVPSLWLLQSSLVKLSAQALMVVRGYVVLPIAFWRSHERRDTFACGCSLSLRVTLSIQFEIGISHPHLHVLPNWL